MYHTPRVDYTCDFRKGFRRFCNVLKTNGINVNYTFIPRKQLAKYENNFLCSAFTTKLTPKNNSDIQIDVLDEAFCQPYDYQYMLDKNPNFEPALVVKEQVEDWMKYLQNNEVISGHVYGEYI